MLKNWIKAARLKTLPLSLSGVILGNLSALEMENTFNGFVFMVAVLTAILLQILSNFANDYGDGMKGTDKNRKGPQRMLQAGLINPKQMKRAVLIFSLLSFFSAIILIFAAFGFENIESILFFLLLSLSGIWAALRYTIGKKAYGYNGFGDIFVFVFFGLVSVLGNYFLQTQTFEILMLLPAIFVGCMSVGVLNLNNMRDYETDKAAHKNTLVVKMGLKKAKIYHFFLITFGFFAVMLFIILRKKDVHFILLLIFIIFKKYDFLFRIKKNIVFDLELGKLSLETFAWSLIFSSL